jgi:hypothetical protein
MVSLATKMLHFAEIQGDADSLKRGDRSMSVAVLGDIEASRSLVHLQVLG